MLFTDRWAWSSKDGKEHLPKESFQLPSVEWIWEGDWYIDRGVDGDNDVIDFIMLHVMYINLKTCDLLQVFMYTLENIDPQIVVWNR